jgi:hypothetical protein
MPIVVQVRVEGLDALKQRYQDPKMVREPMRKFLRDTGNLARRTVRSNIPVRRTRLRPPVAPAALEKWRRPGHTRRSIRLRLRPGKGMAIVSSRYFVARLLETGTRKMTARRPFARAAQAIQGQIQARAQEMARDIAQRLGRN